MRIVSDTIKNNMLRKFKEYDTKRIWHELIKKNDSFRIVVFDEFPPK